ncbi:MAG: prepilin-type N-terminal cleavage/methylation domain-containing protein [Armatimonadota bacterium]
MRYAFTLVELLIVIIIIAVLAAIAIPKITSSTRRSHETHLRAKLRAIRVAVERVRADTGLLPKDLGQLDDSDEPGQLRNSEGNLVSPPSGSWNGPYIDPTTIGLDPNDSTKLRDPVCGGTFGYSLDGRVTPCATGTALDGSNMAAW